MTEKQEVTVIRYHDYRLHFNVLFQLTGTPNMLQLSSISDILPHLFLPRFKYRPDLIGPGKYRSLILSALLQIFVIRHISVKNGDRRYLVLKRSLVA